MDARAVPVVATKVIERTCSGHSSDECPVATLISTPPDALHRFSPYNCCIMVRNRTVSPTVSCPLAAPCK